MKKAIAVERKAHYADFQGKRHTFSGFMRKTASELSRAYPHEPIWVTIRGLFRSYGTTDVASRISILLRVEQLLAGQASGQATGPVGISAGALSISSGSGQSDSKGQSASAASGSGKGSTTYAAGAGTEASSVRENQAQKYNAIKQAQPLKQLPPATVAYLEGKELGEIDVQYVKGVGPRYKTMLANIGVNTIEDLLHHYPRRHIDFSDKVKISSLKPGQEVTIIGVIKSVSAFQSPKSKISILTVIITDGTGSIAVTRFIGGKSNKFLLDRYKSQYPKDCQVMASGLVERDKHYNRYTLKNCELELLGYISDEESKALSREEQDKLRSLNAGRLVPIYPLTEGISARHLRLIIHHALDKYGERIKDIMPVSVKEKYKLIDERTAIDKIHFPETSEEFIEARQRLVFDELFALQLTLAKRRHNFELEEKSITLNTANNLLIEELRKSLPFNLTQAQERVFKEIARDLASTKPMHRLVQGDVGSGKTVVALMAALIAIDNKFQVAMMAPTEILAEQHYNQCKKFIEPLGLKSTIVLGKQGAKERREARELIASGEAHLIVGTHALLEDDVEFQRLGLIIIDEQHRFGVKQRARLKAKSLSPELLTMTATPIPRTLALTIHGDLDVSEIDELPPGRKPIETKLMGPGEKKWLYSFINEQVKLGRQIYIVFPLIEESETLAAKAATIEYEKLKEKIFPDLRIGLMHGKLKPIEKEEVMNDFRAHKYDILVSTTVIEVGVDVPNASVMAIENADRFGLAQLHQLRGRVGRGSDQSYCFLVTDSRTQSTRDRLEVLTQTNDGFIVAEKDLAIRGPGEFLGFRQSGLPDLILTDLTKDTAILTDARHAAIEIIKEDPKLEKYPALLKLLEKHSSKEKSEILHSG